MNKLTILLVFLSALAIASAQYFSSNDGINLPRNGKRSYLGYYLNMKEPTNELFENGQDKFQQTDKLSFRKKFGKYGKRSGTATDELEVSDFDRFNQDSDNLKIKSIIELLNNLEEKQHASQTNAERK